MENNAIPVALGMAAEHTGLNVQFQWLATDGIDEDTPLQDFDGFWCVPAALRGCARLSGPMRSSSNRCGVL